MSEVNRRETLVAGLGLGALAATAGPVAAQGPAVPAAERPTFTLLLVNDIYKLSEERGRGGFARLAAIVKAERARGVPMLYCHAGDCFSPSIMSGFDQGAHIVELINVAPPDVFVPGNHEFDFGKDTYLKRQSEARFPFYAANLRGPGGAELPGHRDNAVVDLGGIKVGVFGIAFDNTARLSSPGDLGFAGEFATVQAQAKAVKDAGAEIVVAVTHTAFDVDLQIFRSRLVDVLLTGHDHDLRVAYDGRVAMVESGEEGQYVTAVDVTAQVTTAGGTRTVAWRPNFRVIDSASVTPDPEAQAIVRRYETELSQQLDVVIGTTAVELDSRSASVRSQETAMGNLIADALRAATGAEIAITNGGGIRGNKTYPAGAQLTRRDILTELPFGNSTSMVEITGADIRAALENGVSLFESRQGRFPQISGMRITVDTSRPPGMRIVEARVGNDLLDAGRTYRVATNNFMVAGGDGYGALGRGRILIGVTDGKLLASDVMTYVRRVGTVNAAPEGRITVR